MSSEIEKREPTVTETSVQENDALAVEESASVGPDRNVTAAIYAIVWGVALPSIPIVVISAVLLYVIFKHQIVPEPGWPELHTAVTAKSSKNALTLLSEIKHQGGKPAYYVAYNPSTITTIASWTGRVIPYLSSSIMALVAFFSARRIVTKSKHGDGTDLPTPEQFTLLIGLLGGSSFGPLKDTVVYRWAKKERLVDPLPTAFTALFLVTVIGLLIPIVDTWFGVAVHPAVITQLYNDTKNYHSFGLQLSKTRCANGAGEFNGIFGGEWTPCNLVSHTGPVSDVNMINADEASRIAAGVSTRHTVMNYTTNSSDTYFYLADVRADQKLDFKAETYAVSTHCKPITQRCMPGQEWPNPTEYKFACTPGFKANFTFTGQVQQIDAFTEQGGINQGGDVPVVGIGFSPDDQLSRRVGEYDKAWHDANDAAGQAEYPQALGPNTSYEYVLPRNPLHFATWASGYPTVDTAEDQAQPLLISDPQIFYDVAGFTYWILQCSSSVYSVSYTWVNGSIHTFSTKLASPEMGGLISGPFAFSLPPAQISLSQLSNLAGFSNTSTDLADVWAHGFSKAALAMSIGALAPSVNEIEQLRNSTVATARIPIIPLYCLLGFKALYVIAVITLAIGAYCFTHPAETEVVKAQLSVKGLAAAHFDQPQLLQENVVKEVQSRLQAAKEPRRSNTNPADGNAAEDKERAQELKRANTAPVSASRAAEQKKVGLVLNPDGAWQFAIVANGVWNSIKPIAESFVVSEAKSGKLGDVGDIINAWK